MYSKHGFNKQILSRKVKLKISHLNNYNVHGLIQCTIQLFEHIEKFLLEPYKFFLER